MRTVAGAAVLSTVVIVAGSGVTLPSPGEAAGPWTAQVVNAETGQPLEGVVVLAVWYRRYTSPGGWAGGGYYASEEVVTGPDGRFVIDARATWTLLPFVTIIKGPEFLIFKPGYGRWRFQGSEAWPLDVVERPEYVKKAWEQFTGEGVVLELAPLKTREERLKALSQASPSGEIPDARMRRYLEALDQEAVSLGLQPTGRGKIGRDK